MIPVKNNCINQQDLIWSGCKTEIETHYHVLQTCITIHKDENTKVTKDDYFSEDLQTLKKAAHNIQMILDWIDQSDVPSCLTNHEAWPGIQAHTR